MLYLKIENDLEQKFTSNLPREPRSTFSEQNVRKLTLLHQEFQISKDWQGR